MRARFWLALGVSALIATASVADSRATRGPKDGEHLPATDLDRVRVGESAPDFTLEDEAGVPITLSDFRGRASVILVFYRGRW